MGGPEPLVPQTMAEAADLGDRRALLSLARRRIAEVLDCGVPPHTMGRLIAEMDRLDAEVQRLGEEVDLSHEEIADEPFDPSEF